MSVSSRDRAFLEVARHLASRSTEPNKHGAVLMRGGRVLSTGINSKRNDPLVVASEHIKSGCSEHAEAAAFRRAAGKSEDHLKGATLYVARVNNHGQDRDSRPCPACMELIRLYKVKKVVYTTSAGVLYPGRH